MSELIYLFSNIVKISLSSAAAKKEMTFKANTLFLVKNWGSHKNSYSIIMVKMILYVKIHTSTDKYF